ncbi:hypothetical protein E3N88_26532 [Mikania micrantha]|uniref:Uncharacterized protein n=1 Tax=Mikania micrantha TaxID=192012 RepID=A0A5N6MUS2_9ASTR|nr:hypothetical protein E3N88_26532 [Mikania micrantha]
MKKETDSFRNGIYVRALAMVLKEVPAGGNRDCAGGSLQPDHGDNVVHRPQALDRPEEVPHDEGGNRD